MLDQIFVSEERRVAPNADVKLTSCVQIASHIAILLAYLVIGTDSKEAIKLIASLITADYR